jgi:CheY-like chemotaxis protein
VQAMSTRILYVEDDYDVRTMLHDLLRSEGYDVVALSTAEDAVKVLETSRFPIFLTDYNLPNRNADWMLRVASQRGYLADTTVIVLSGAVDPKGIDGHQLLQKPVDVDVLLATVQHALSGRLDNAHELEGQEPSGDTDVILKLYFSGVSAESRRAVRNLRRVLKEFDPDRIRLDVHDISDREAPVAPLEQDRIVVTPTLVRKHPLPKLWILGDLSKVEVVRDMITAGLTGTISSDAT